MLVTTRFASMVGIAGLLMAAGPGHTGTTPAEKCTTSTTTTMP
jgi:hypothetical protein